MYIELKNERYQSLETLILPYEIVKNILNNLRPNIELNVLSLLTVLQKEIIDLLLINFPDLDRKTIRRLNMEELTNIAANLFNESMSAISDTLAEDQGRVLTINSYMAGYGNSPTTFTTNYLSLTLGVIEDITALYETLNSKNTQEILQNLPIDTIKQLLEDLEDLFLDTFEGLTLLALDKTNVIDIIKVFKDSFLYGTSLLSQLGDNDKKN